MTVDLKRKLERLASPAATPTERGDPIADLRRRMAEILVRERPEKKRTLPERDFAELPFARVEEKDGPIFRRFERYGRAHAVGRISVDAASTACAEVLSLVALDPFLAEADPARALYLDTETTGLGGSGTVAFLVGLGAFDGGNFVLEQLLLRTPDEEAPLLGRVAARLASASMVVTFNGKAFDVPMLESRFVMNRLQVPPRLPHLDLLHVARRVHRRRLRSCTLKSIEAGVLGFVRDADIDGADVAPRYGHFLRTGDESALVTVVDHNAWDVASMAALVGLYGEPLESLHGDDLVGLAQAYRRARAFDRADAAIEVAIVRGAGHEALRVRGDVAKARGDRARALRDFEAFAAVVDDPVARLELAKLYEHFVKEPARALELVERGTGERPDVATRRRSRLKRKIGAGDGRS